MKRRYGSGIGKIVKRITDHTQPIYQYGAEDEKGSWTVDQQQIKAKVKGKPDVAANVILESLGIFKAAISMMKKLKKANDDLHKQKTNEDIAEMTGKKILEFISTNISQGLSNFTTTTQEANSVETTPETTYALVVEEKPSEGVAQPFDSQTWADVAKGTISDKLGDIPVKKSILSKGKGIMKFPDMNSRDLAAEALKEDFTLVKEEGKSNKLLPKMKICDLEGYGKDDLQKLKADILKKSPSIRTMTDSSKTLDIIFIHEPADSTGYSYAVIRVDPRIREEIIKNQRRIYIGTTSCHVKDQIHVTQCFACQEFGHKKDSPHCKFAKTDKHICLYCAKTDHMSKNCPVKKNMAKYNCTNCKNTTKYAKSANHTSTNITCPIYIREADKIIKRTVCDPKNFPILRTSQRQF